MIKKKALILISLVFTAVFSLSAFAASGVYDDAGLFYDTEVTTLQMELDDLCSQTGWDAAVVTTDDAVGVSSTVYADDFYDDLGFGDDGILYLLDMDNREIYISTAGEAAEYLTDSRIDNMLDSAVEYASNGSYYDAMYTQITMTVDYYNAGIPVDSSAAAAKITVLVAAVLIGVIAAVSAVFSVKKSYGFKDTGYVYEYSSKSRLNLTTNTDSLINSFVTTRIRPRPKNNSGGRSGRSGGSSMHTSSSGRSHGGGGRSF